MERLHDLLRRKVQREHLSSASVGAAMSGQTGSVKVCWLCGLETRKRYRFKDTTFLCFQCFRTAYIALVLPFINTPARRESDAALLKRIERMAVQRRASSQEVSTTNESGSPDGCSVFEPSQASFVMSASRMRQRLQSEVDSPSSPSSPRQYWNCARCTYVNPLSAMRCEACDYFNHSTVRCRHCGLHCPVDPEASASQRRVCANGKPHVMWYCGECGAMNTLDGDQCELCHQSRYWACSYCTAVHNVRRTHEGLRYCAVCGSYNTPQDVLKGQEKVDAEQKAILAATQQRQAARVGAGSAVHGVDQGGADAGGVVFGVNDEQTLEEQRRQREIEANIRRLNMRLDALRIRRISQKSDGNCLFAALAHQLFGNSMLSFLVRSCVVSYMRANAEDYSILFDGEEEWAMYLYQMRESGFWGDELCINAAARCFCVNVHVITSDPTRWHIVFEHDELGHSHNNPQGRPALNPGESPREQLSRSSVGGGPAAPAQGGTLNLFLAYLYPVHYDDVTPMAVPTVVLSDLVLPELHKLLIMEGGTAPTPPLRTVRPPSWAESAQTSMTVSGLYSNARPPSLGSLAGPHSEQAQRSRGSAPPLSPTTEHGISPHSWGLVRAPTPASGAEPLSSYTHPLPPPPSSPSGRLGSGSSYPNGVLFRR